MASDNRDINTRLWIRTFADAALLIAAYGLAFLVRFDANLPLQMWKRLLFTLPYVTFFQFAVLNLFSVPKFAWSYVGLREAARIFWAVATASSILLIARLVSARILPHWDYAQYALVPIGVIAMDTVLAFLALAGARVLRRITQERAATSRRKQVERVPTLLVGAGMAGSLVSKELARHPELPMEPVAFLDDDPNKKGLIIQGVPVLGSTAQLAEVARSTGARQALITMPEATGVTYRRLIGLCREAGIQTKVVPGVFQLLDGKLNLSRIRDVSIEDLLGREAVRLDEGLVSVFIARKRVVVTGAGGSIGSELCRQVARFGPKTLLLLEQSEPALFEIHQELIKSYPDIEIIPLIVDIADSLRVDAVFSAHRPEVVFHAAAHKHVPMMELNPGEAIKNNVFGTKTVADLANRHGADAFVLISTDKAVNPTSVMGATKRVAEMYVQALSGKSNTKFVAVRFGNVLGSAGSVIPVFKKQIQEGGPVTVTHPDMVRYFMTIPEASQLVMQSAAMGESGQIFVLNMGEPVKIVDLARELIRLSGFEPDVDIAITYSGIRPGEKLFEELSFDAERMTRTEHEKIFIGKLDRRPLEEVSAKLEILANVAHSMNSELVRAALARVVPEMQAPARDDVERPAPAESLALPMLPAELVPAAAENIG